MAHWVSAFGSPGLNFDEFRLGTNWASVTPPGGDGDTRMVFDFDDGTYQGWTQVMTNADYSPQAFVVAAGADAACKRQEHVCSVRNGCVAADVQSRLGWSSMTEFTFL